MSGGAFTVQLRDWSPAGRADLEALVRRYDGDPSGTGDQLTVRADAGPPTRSSTS